MLVFTVCSALTQRAAGFITVSPQHSGGPILDGSYCSQELRDQLPPFLLPHSLPGSVLFLLLSPCQPETTGRDNGL